MRDVDYHKDDGPVLNSEKLREAILFFVQGSQHGHLSRARLMTLLYFADFDFYERFDRSITGARYTRLDHGPESEAATTALAELERLGRISRRTIVAEGHHQHLYATREHAQISVLSDAELVSLKQVLLQWASITDEKLEAAMRDEAPLVAVKINDVIPYYLAHYRDNYGSMQLDADELAYMAQAQDEDEVIVR